MSDIRNKYLENIINKIFPMKRNTVDTSKRQVIIGDGKYANKCSFRETDKEYYITLLKYTFTVSETEFVDKDRNRYVGFDRLTAVDNAIKYLNKIGIVIKCTLYCDSERTLLARYIYNVFEGILSVMFSFGKNFDNGKYEKSLNEMIKHYRREIVTKGIIPLIYANAIWSDVELYKRSEDSNDCLLLDNGFDWRNYYGICHVNTGLKLQIKSDEDTYFYSGIVRQCDKAYNLQNKLVPVREDTFYYLDLFHLDHDYYVPNRFCYCTNIESNAVKEKLECERTIAHDLPRSFASEYVINVPEFGSTEFEQAFRYLHQTYCSDRRRQYMNTFSIIAEIMGILLRTNYKDFYSDKFNISKTAFGVGLDQLKYFFEDNKIEYNKKDINTIYKYLITVWLESFRYYLKLYNFEEMFNLYSNNVENKEYKNCIDANRKKINLYNDLNVLVNAHDSYKNFYERNIEVINSFESKVSVEKNESIEQMAARKFKAEYNPFKMLKESIKTFQQKLEWKVPYYVRITAVEGEDKHEYVDAFQGYGHVGDKKRIEIPQDEKFTIEGPDYITLGFNDNIVKIKYELKAEYVSEQPNKNDCQNTIGNTDAEVILKKNHKYHIEFEAYGNSNAPFSFIIIRRNINKSFENVFEKNDIELGSTFKRYSFDFTYNGEAEDLCYLVFGYGNMTDGYKIQNIKLSEIE